MNTTNPQRFMQFAARNFASTAVAALMGCSANAPSVKVEERQSGAEFQSEFGLEQRNLATTGRNAFFVLEPGFQLELANDDTKLTITVLDETKQIGGVTARVVEEREEEKGLLVELSRNYFAIDSLTNDVFYFGEDVDVFKNGKLSGHPGVWLAGQNGARAGLVAPGTPRVGMRYFQEYAPKVALDCAEVVDVALTLKTPAGEFKDCLRTHESTGLDKHESEYKVYARDIGLIQDEDLLLVRFGNTHTR